MSFGKAKKCARQAGTLSACRPKVLPLVKVQSKRGYFNEHPTALMTAAPNLPLKCLTKARRSFPIVLWIRHTNQCTAAEYGIEFVCKPVKEDKLKRCWGAHHAIEVGLWRGDAIARACVCSCQVFTARKATTCWDTRLFDALDHSQRDLGLSAIIAWWWRQFFI